MFFVRNITGILLSCLLLPMAAQSVEFDVQVERVLWRYQEDTKQAEAYANLPSKAEGSGALVKLRLSSERDEDWFFALTAGLMDSSSAAEEKWGSIQVNDLTIKQRDIRLDMQYRMLDARFGLWLADRQQNQERSNLDCPTCTPTFLAGPVSEDIKSQWAGLSLTSVGGNVGQFEASIEAALALNMDVANSLLTTNYTKKDGYRTAIHFRWTLPRSEVGVSGLNLTLRYEYQGIGGEKSVSGTFWPYNRWQMASMGLLYAW